MLEKLKNEVWEANLLLPKYGLVSFTWGNVSGIDRESGMVVIKPSGIDYEKLKPEDMVVVELSSGKVTDGTLRPSSDTPTHIELYKSFKNIGGVVHTHSINATCFAQAKMPLPPLGTTHADYFYGAVPCTRDLSASEIKDGYESNTGKVIAECFEKLGLNPLEIPAVLAASHGPFTWGKDAFAAVRNSAVLETVAEMALRTLLLTNSRSEPISQHILDKHYYRKHGGGAYYGQPDKY